MFCNIAFYPKDEGNRFLRNIGTCPPNDTMAYPSFRAIETVHLRAAFLWDIAFRHWVFVVQRFPDRVVTSYPNVSGLLKKCYALECHNISVIKGTDCYIFHAYIY